MRRIKWSLLRLFCPREEAEYSELLQLVLITPLHRGAPMFSATAELSLQSFHETGRARLISSLEQEGCKPPQGPESTGSVKLCWRNMLLTAKSFHSTQPDSFLFALGSWL